MFFFLIYFIKLRIILISTSYYKDLMMYLFFFIIILYLIYKYLVSVKQLDPTYAMYCKNLIFFLLVTMMLLSFWWWYQLPWTRLDKQRPIIAFIYKFFEISPPWQYLEELSIDITDSHRPFFYSAYSRIAILVTIFIIWKVRYIIRSWQSLTSSERFSTIGDIIIATCFCLHLLSLWLEAVIITPLDKPDIEIAIFCKFFEIPTPWVFLEVFIYNTNDPYAPNYLGLPRLELIDYITILITYLVLGIIIYIYIKYFEPEDHRERRLKGHFITIVKVSYHILVIYRYINPIIKKVKEWLNKYFF